jgi:hypothetical protein
MEMNDIINQAKRIMNETEADNSFGKLAEAKEFFRVYGGKNNSFCKNLDNISLSTSRSYMAEAIKMNLESFINYVENGLLDGVSVERNARIDVVSDYLDQANSLLNTKSVHPAAPTVIIGASLEEFLRNWVEDLELSLTEKKACLDTYAKVLYEADKITKQDMKDITAWGGLRNHAAHGEWNEVDDKKRIAIMLEGVNLFMRKYGNRV